MKKVLSLLAGMVFVLAFGVAYGDELQPGDGYTSDKMINNEDVQKYDQDMGPGGIVTMPTLPDEIQGTAAGGGSKDTESDGKSDTYEKVAPVEKDKTKPSDSRDDMGGPSRGWNPSGY